MSETGRASIDDVASLATFSTNDADVLKGTAAVTKAGDSMVQVEANQESSKARDDESIASTSDVSSANAKTADAHGADVEAAIDNLFANFDESLLDDLLAV